MTNLRNLVWGIQCEWVPLVYVLVGVGRDIQWYSYLLNMVELIQAPPMGYQIGIKMKSLRDIQWKSKNLVKTQEVR